MEIKDLAGLSGPTTRLIEAVEKAVSGILAPWQTRRLAKADVDADTIRAKGALEIAELVARAGYRVDGRELRRQVNLEAITGRAIQQLQEPSAASEAAPKPVDPDWMAEFVNSAQDVSNDEMQSLWARILAGEVKVSGSFSRRTLAAVRVMSREDADRLTRFCSFVWWIGGAAFAVHDPNSEDLFRQAAVVYGTLMALRVTGLIAAEGLGPAGVTHRLERGREYTLDYFDSSIKGCARQSESFLEVTPLTQVGMELEQIAGAERNEEYFKRCLAYFRANGLELEGVPE